MLLSSLILISTLIPPEARAGLFDKIEIGQSICGSSGVCGSASATAGDFIDLMDTSSSSGSGTMKEPKYVPSKERLTPLADVPEGKKISYLSFKQIPDYYRIEKVGKRFGRPGTLTERWEHKGVIHETFAWRSKTQVIEIETEDGVTSDRTYTDVR
ncbi:MAG: hypothetical protein EOP05_18735 [Proteobacteria bacterium]|nr:MAG: hypothetical protein EOP05_18735 [Pseudomonadota bacterium]